MALNLSTLRKPLNRQVVDPSTGVMREEWELYFNQLTKHVNSAVGDAAAASYGYFDVRDFGAVGDGTTSDAIAFQAANDAAEASSTIKRVYVPHSSAGYALGATVVVSEGVVFFGDNRKGLELSRIKPASGFTDPLFESDDYGNSRKLRIGLEGLFLDGSSTTLTAVAMNVQESHFRDLTIKNCFTYGIHIGGIGSGGTQQALNNHIEDCYLAGQIGSVEFFDGIFLDYFTADTTIRDCYIEASKDAGIRSRGYNNKILNNHIYAVAGTGGGLGVGIYTETSADQDISHNYIELCAASGVLINGGGSDVATLNAVVSGNAFRNIDTGNTSSGVVVVQGSDVSSVAVADNVVRRDAATSYATAYFAYFNGITPALAKVSGNIWQSGLVTTGESNLFRPPVALQVFTSSGTYTPTSGMAVCLVISTGGGGGGGGADCSDTTAVAIGGGGGGGATCIELFTAAQIGASQTVTIGAAGTAGANTGGDGGAGGNTTFGSLHTAGGGAGGDGILNGDGSSAAIGNNVAGGTATGGLINLPGGKGQSGFYDDSSFTTTGGAGGGSFWMGINWSNRQTAFPGSQAGANGAGPGQGGGGACAEDTTTGAAGGTGSAGFVLVIEFLQ